MKSHNGQCEQKGHNGKTLWSLGRLMKIFFSQNGHIGKKIYCGHNNKITQNDVSGFFLQYQIFTI